MWITPSGLLQEGIVKAALRSAWHESSSGISGGHEEGGFVLQSLDNKIRFLYLYIIIVALTGMTFKRMKMSIIRLECLIRL